MSRPTSREQLLERIVTDCERLGEVVEQVDVRTSREARAADSRTLGA